MKKRNCGMMLRFTKSEMDALTKKARKAGLSREGYCRRVLNGSEVKEAPPADVPVLIREVRRAGSNIEQVLKLANAKGLLDVPQIRKALEENRAADKLIVETYAMVSE
jgi:hypothetical protein